MSRKIFYFVRHGESIQNASHIRQSREGGLTEKGKEQVKATGVLLTKLNFKKILASPYERTKQTAEIISACFKHPLPIYYNEVLIERKNPTEIVGKSTNDPEIKKIVDLIDNSYHSDDYRFSDEENFLDLKARAKKVLRFLSHQHGKYILVVTHGILLRMMAAYMLHGDELTASQYNVLSFVNSANNAGITICEYKRHWFRLSSHTEWSLLAWDKQPKSFYATINT